MIGHRCFLGLAVLLAPITLKSPRPSLPHYTVFFLKHLQVAAVLTLSEAVYKQVTCISSDWQPGSCILQPHINHYFIKLCCDGVALYFLFIFQHSGVHKFKKYVLILFHKEVHAYDCVCIMVPS